MFTVKKIYGSKKGKDDQTQGNHFNLTKFELTCIIIIGVLVIALIASFMINCKKAINEEKVDESSEMQISPLI